MATKDDTQKAAAPVKAAASKADHAPAKDADAKAPADAKAAPSDVDVVEEERVSTCVVNDGRGLHVGNAVNGLVCSYHAMHYDSAGNRR